MPKKVWNIISFEKGINKVLNPRVLTPSESYQIKNLDITNGSLLKTFRTSFRRIWSQAGWDSLFSITSITDNIISPPGDFNWTQDILSLGTVNPEMDPTNTDLFNACNTPISSHANGFNLYYCSHDYQFPVPKEIHLREIEYPIDEVYSYYSVGGVTYTEDSQAGYDNTLPFQDILADPYWNSDIAGEPQDGDVYKDGGAEFILYAIQTGLAADYGYEEGAQIHIYDMTNNVVMADAIRLDHIPNDEHYSVGPPRVCYNYVDGSLRMLDSNFNRNTPNIINDTGVFKILSNHMAKTQYLKKILFPAITPDEAAEIDDNNEFTGGTNIINDEDFSLGIPIAAGEGGATWWQRYQEEDNSLDMPIVGNTDLTDIMFYHPQWYSKDDTNYPSNNYNPHYMEMSGEGSIPASGDPYPGSASMGQTGLAPSGELGVTPPDEIHDADAVCFIQWVMYSHVALDDYPGNISPNGWEWFLFNHGQHGDDMFVDSISLFEYNNYINGLFQSWGGFDESYMPFILHHPFTSSQQNDFSAATNGLHQLEFEYKLVAKCTKTGDWQNNLETVGAPQGAAGETFYGYLRLNFWWGSVYGAEDFLGTENSIEMYINDTQLNQWQTFREYTIAGPIGVNGTDLADYLSFAPEFIGNMVDDDNISDPGEPQTSFWQNGDRIHLYICIRNVRLSPWDPSAANMVVGNPVTAQWLVNPQEPYGYQGDESDPWHLALREPEGTTLMQDAVLMLGDGEGDEDEYEYDANVDPIQRRFWNGYVQHITTKYFLEFGDYRHHHNPAGTEDKGHRGPLPISGNTWNIPSVSPISYQIPFAWGTAENGNEYSDPTNSDKGWVSIGDGIVYPGEWIDHAVMGFPDANAYDTNTVLPEEIGILSMYQKINKPACVYSSYYLEMQMKFEYCPMAGSGLGTFLNVNDGASMGDQDQAITFIYESWVEQIGKHVLTYKYVDPDDNIEKVAEWGYVRDNVPSIEGTDIYGLIGYAINLYYRDGEGGSGTREWRLHTVPFVPHQGSWNTGGSGGEIWLDEDEEVLGPFTALSLDQQQEAIFHDLVKVPPFVWYSYQGDPLHGLSGWTWSLGGNPYKDTSHITARATFGSDFPIFHHMYTFVDQGSSIHDSHVFEYEDVNDNNEILIKKMKNVVEYDYLQIVDIRGCTLDVNGNGWSVLPPNFYHNSSLAMGYVNTGLFSAEVTSGAPLFQNIMNNNDGISDIVISKTDDSVVIQEDAFFEYEGELPVNRWMVNPGLFPEPPINSSYESPGGYFVEDNINYGGNDVQSLAGNLQDVFIPEGKVYIHVYAGSLGSNGLWSGGYYQIGISYYDWDGNETEVYFDKEFAGDSEFYIEDGKMLRMNAFFVPVHDGSYDSGDFDRRVAGFRIYMRRRETSKWEYLMMDISYEKGYMIEVPGGDWKPLRQLQQVDQGIIGTNSSSASNIHYTHPPIIGFYELNRWDGKESNRFRYKTSTVVGRRMFIGNVAELFHRRDVSDMANQYKIKNVFPDRMMASPTNQFDIFPKSQHVDAAIADGDEIIFLTSIGMKLLQFRRNTLYVINVSKAIESLESTHPGKGVESSSQVCTFTDGIAWVNNSGVYIYNGQNMVGIHTGKVSRHIMQELFQYDSKLCIFFLAEKNSLVIINSYENKEFWYNLGLQAWTVGENNFKKTKLPAQDDQDWFGSQTDILGEGGIRSSKVDILSNIINTRDGRIAFVDINGLNVGGHSMLSLNPQEPSDQGIYIDNPNSLDYFDKNALGRKIEYQTGDIDFGVPSIKKTIDRVVIRYKSNQLNENQSTQIYWGKNGEHALEIKREFEGFETEHNIAPLSSTHATGTDAPDGYDWHTKEFDPGSDAKNIYSFTLGIQGSNGELGSSTDPEEPLGLMIDSIQIFYKQKGIK